MFQELQTTISNAWTWWWLYNNDLSAMVIASTASFLIVLWFIWIYYVKSEKVNPPLPPGPRRLPLVGNLLSLDPELHTYFAGQARTYGPILTLQLGQKVGIVVTSPALAREVLKEQDSKFANRDVPVAGLEATYGGKDIVWTPYGPEWRMLRKVCVREMLSNATLDSVYTLRRKEVRQTIGYIYSKVGSPVNIGEQMFLTVLNVITSMMWGGTVEGEARAELGAEFRQLVNDMTGLLGMPNVSDFYPHLARFDLQGIQKKMKGLAIRLDEIFETMISQRQKMEEKKDGSNKDFLEFLLKLKDEQDAQVPFTMTHVKALLMVCPTFNSPLYNIIFTSLIFIFPKNIS